MRVGGWLLLLTAALWATAAQAGRSEDLGAPFARRACAGCHAVGVSGPSPLAQAPPFRRIPERLPGRRLTTALRAISAHGHGLMPPIYMTPKERRAVEGYIRTIAARSHRRVA
jgi:mono/diheme cytochrome c family protein